MMRWGTYPGGDTPRLDLPALAVLAVCLVVAWCAWVALGESEQAPDRFDPAVYVVDAPTAQAERVP
jgi:hypothetical protein